MNAPFDDVAQLGRLPIGPLVESTGLSLHARLVAIYLAWWSRHAGAVVNGTVVERGDVWRARDTIASHLGFSAKTVDRALRELERAGVVVPTGKLINRVPVRNVRPQKLDGATPSLRLGRPKQRPCRTASNWTCDPASNSSCDPATNSPCDPATNLSCDPQTNWAHKPSQFNSQIEQHSTPQPPLHGEKAGEEDADASLRAPRAAIDTAAGAAAADVVDRALWAELRRLAYETEDAWLGSAGSERWALIQLAAKDRRTHTDGRTHAEVAHERGQLEAWVRKHLVDAQVAKKDGRSPFARWHSSAPPLSPEERAAHAAKKKAIEELGQQYVPEIVVEPIVTDDGRVDFAGMQRAWKQARGEA